MNHRSSWNQGQQGQDTHGQYGQSQQGRGQYGGTGSGGSSYGASGYGGYGGQGQYGQRGWQSGQDQRYGGGAQRQDFGPSGYAGGGASSYGGYGSSGDYGYGSRGDYAQAQYGRQGQDWQETHFTPDLDRDFGSGWQQYGQERYRPVPSTQGQAQPQHRQDQPWQPQFGGGAEQEPRYFGTGNYASGGAGFGGGFGEERYRGGYGSQGAGFYGQGGGVRGQSIQGYPAQGYGSQSYGGEHYGRGGRAYGDSPAYGDARGFGGLRSERARRGPKGYQRSDERLKEDISERLMRAEDVDSSEVTISVSAGKVTLEGTVPERYMKHAIEDLADRCPGVQDIDNRIRVQSQSEHGESGAQR